MILYRNSHGLLKNKTVINGIFYYTVELKNGKTKTICFSKDVCPKANINDEVFFTYKTSFSENKKGILLSNRLNDIFAGQKESFLFKDLIVTFFSTIFTFELFMFKLIDYMSVSNYISGKNLLLIAVIFSSWIVFVIKFLINDLSYFIDIKNKKDTAYNEYIKQQFNRKERLFNKKLNNLEKMHLSNFINQQEHLSSGEKIEISSIIESQKKISISDIRFLEIKNLKEKQKRQKEIQLLISK